MRSGQFIRALGRQSFETSQPTAPSDHSGHPSSTEQAQERMRLLVKAQNDVLATVGVCYQKDSAEKDTTTFAENEAGLIVGAVDLSLTYLASWPVVGMRNRLQAYRVEDGLRYVDLLKRAWIRNTTAQLFSGMPAHLCYQLILLLRDFLQVRFFSWLSRRPMFKDPVTKKAQGRFWLELTFLERASFGSWFLIYPLIYHSYLQTLHLIPPLPLIPPLMEFIPFSAASPLSLPILTGPLLSLVNIKTVAMHIGSSYFLHSFLTHAVSVALQFKLFKRILKLLPSPADEKQHISAADEAGATTLAAEFTLETPMGIGAINIEAIDSTSETRVFTATVHADPDSVRNDTSAQDGLFVDAEADTPAENVNSSTTNEGTPANGPAAPTNTPLGENTALPSASNPGPPPPPPPPPPQSFAMQPLPTAYRSTTLSSHPVDVVASHLADCAANVVIVWAETAILRTLARSVLFGRGVTPSIVNSMIYRPFELKGINIVAKAMVIGEWSLMWLLFEGTYFISTWVGMKWFGYLRV